MTANSLAGLRSVFLSRRSDVCAQDATEAGGTDLEIGCNSMTVSLGQGLENERKGVIAQWQQLVAGFPVDVKL